MNASFARTALREISEQQSRWAALHEVDLDESGATATLHGNLFGPLSGALQEALSGRVDKPLGDGLKPGPITRLDSTHALVANVFDHWSERDLEPLLGALGAPPDGAEIEFEARMTLRDQPIDAAHLMLCGGARPIAVVASFSESYLPGGPGRARPFADCAEPGVWGTLQDCRQLALDRAANPDRHQRVDVTGLLERILALSSHFGARNFELLYLWYEVPGHAATQTRREIDRLRMRIGGEVAFRALTWQQLFARIEASSEGHSRPAAYLAARYFSC